MSKKRYKGPKQPQPKINKATIYFLGGVEYTIKRFSLMEWYSAENTFIFTIKEEFSQTITKTEKIFVPGHDVTAIDVRGKENQFHLTMLPDNTLNLEADGIILEVTDLHLTV